jgi:SOS response regulatory protein OraA/RecX
MRFLAGRGFSADVIRSVVAGEDAEDDPSDADA